MPNLTALRSYRFCLVVAGLMLGSQGAAWASSYWPLVGRGSSSYSTVYSPDPTQTNSILYIDNAAKEVNISSGYGQSNNLEWRVFVPPGTKALDIFMYTFSAPQETKVTARFGAPPLGPVDAVNAAAGAFPGSLALPKLLAGEELVYFGQVFTNVVNGVPYQSSNGGTRLVSRPDYLPYVPTTKGGWIYFKTWQVPGQLIQGIDVNIKVDETCYRSWFANAKFDASGNPQEDVEHTCAGSGSSGVPITPLQSISLSPMAELVKGTTNTVNILPFPAGASLPTCTATDSSGLSSTQVTINGSNISLNPNAPSIAASQNVTIRCGQVAADLTISPAPAPVALTGISLSAGTLLNNSTSGLTIIAEPAGAVLPACVSLLPGFNFPNPYVKIVGNKITLTEKGTNVVEESQISVDCGGFKTSFALTVPLALKESVDADGNLILSFKLPSLSSEIGKTKKVWIAARLPASSSFVTTDSWFFKTPTDWLTLILPNLDLLVFKTYTAGTAAQDFVVATGLPKDLMQFYSLEIHLGYQTTAGEFQNMGRIWK